MLEYKQIIEIIGYTGSILVAISLTMSSIVKLRILNLIGALVFSTYGFIIGAYPVGFLNAFISIVDIYYLYEILSQKEYFKVQEFSRDSSYLNYFLKFHEKDIRKFIPTFNFQPNEKWKILFVLRNSIPAGLVCTEYFDENSLFINLDYAIPGYRDFKIGKYVHQVLFKDMNVKRIYAEAGNKRHNQYLEKVGFVEVNINNRKLYCLLKKNDNDNKQTVN